MPKNKEKRALKGWAVFSGIGIQMGVIIYLGNLLGAWLDTKFQAEFLETTLTLAAIFIAMFSVIYQVNRYNARNK